MLITSVDSPVDPGDTLLNHYLIATWAKICSSHGTRIRTLPPCGHASASQRCQYEGGHLRLRYTSCATTKISLIIIHRRRRGERGGTRRLGDTTTRRPDCWHPDVGHRREMPGVRDISNILLDSSSSIRALSRSEPRANPPIITILFS